MSDNPLAGWENDMKSTRIIETDLHGAIEAVRAGKKVYINRECIVHVDSKAFTYLVGSYAGSFYYKLECEKREFVVLADTVESDRRLTVIIPDRIPVGTSCYVTVEIPVNASPTPEV